MPNIKEIQYTPNKPARKALEWLTAYCPICNKAYEYLPNYKPSTCGAFTCLQEYLKIK